MMTDDYKTLLNQRYWEYQRKFFSNWQDTFERPRAEGSRPPVFLTPKAGLNVITSLDHEAKKAQVLGLLPGVERHKWFRSMNSSQALAQSVFGNLAVYDQLWVLEKIRDSEGRKLFGEAKLCVENFKMEHKINYLKEPRPTSLDVFLSGAYRIAIECKFTEAEIGTCSRPRLTPGSANYTRDFCDGSYSIQRTRKERCSLTEIGVLYWKYIPRLFHWKSDIDYTHCPLSSNYQLVRNILAAGVKPDGSVSLHDNHTLLIYDERNPSFQEGGPGWRSYTETRNALIEPGQLRKCSWQRIIKVMREVQCLPWLTEQLEFKYGL